jgi:tripartite-type tricarboxylate transporter receptor subunit TctC
VKRREWLKFAALASLAPVLLASLLARAALAQSVYPDKPVRIVVDSAVGSANDATARILADKLGQIWNQQVVIFNQPGAGGGISARVAAQAPPDGYTLYMPATSVFLALPGGRASRRICRSNCCATLRRSALFCSSRSSSPHRQWPASIPFPN